MEQGIKGNAAKGVLLIQIKVRKPFKPGADLDGSVNIHIDPSFGEAFEIDLFLKDLFPRWTMGWFEGHTTLTCMASGTVLTLAVHHESDDYLHTIVLAVIGAASSFLVSEFLKWIIRVLRRK